MSALAYVASRARVTVVLVAPVVLELWYEGDPANCVSDHDHQYKLVALAALLLSAVPVALGAIDRRLAKRLSIRPRISRAWRIPDVAVLLGMVGILLYMQSGQGRMVDDDGCGIVLPTPPRSTSP